MFLILAHVYQNHHTSMTNHCGYAKRSPRGSTQRTNNAHWSFSGQNPEQKQQLLQIWGIYLIEMSPSMTMYCVPEDLCCICYHMRQMCGFLHRKHGKETTGAHQATHVGGDFCKKSATEMLDPEFQSKRQDNTEEQGQPQHFRDHSNTQKQTPNQQQKGTTRS